MVDFSPEDKFKQLNGVIQNHKILTIYLFLDGFTRFHVQQETKGNEEVQEEEARLEKFAQDLEKG